ncbi:putative dehydrogenase [Shewanella psychrophila]|uniref:Putative dehydrogenase n=1 Tax=Shewanella psychrophila TaxID=225848 RepID=A0A1S6HLB0_9GAMM|nr:Gfo/Idh/MocA family oxidoreductase [Shewanella psychrophila]AQS36300.1 putative dehydrogenase [Shewanella psychrophila]
MDQLRVGVVGSGLIAGVLARAIKAAKGIALTAVASRRLSSSESFAKEHEIENVFTSWQDLINSNKVDIVYIATPTSVREEISIAATNANKHIIAEKPFADLASLKRITSAARENRVAFMDATHFVHHQRSPQLQALQLDEIGEVQAVNSNFFFPLMERDNIRFDLEKEPTGAVGDMAWYCMRAITEYLRPESDLIKVEGSIIRDNQTDAVIRGSGLLVFADGKSSTINFGYNAGVGLMDLDIIGHTGIFRLDDFVLDWKQGFAFDNPEHKTGFYKRSGMQSPAEYQFIESETDKPQAELMLEKFIKLVAAPTSADSLASMRISEQTQFLLDEYWNSVNE